MDSVRWRLKAYLQEHDLTEEALAQVSNLSPRLVRALTVEEAGQVRLETLAGLLGGLRALTGSEVALSDVLAYSTDDTTVDDATVNDTTVDNAEDVLLSGTADLQWSLDDLERDLPPDEIDAWLGAFAAAASKHAE